MKVCLTLALAAASCANAESSLDRQLASIAVQRDAVAARARPSVEAQLASVQKQVQLVPGERNLFASPDQPVSGGEQNCDPLNPMEARGMVETAARNAGISADLLHAVATQESAFRPCAVSVKGAQGLMQLMPATAVQFGVRDSFNPAESLAAGASLLKQLMVRYSGDLNRVLGAYNAGPARVDAADGIPMIPETMQYVEKILGRLP
ncbi:MAG: lytic transglycosylase domain-containing protein [Acidobacteriota bacterium]|nr:lytic transglycosylase domain-containing protein [Acidobacteriota bacterium]